MSKFHQSNQCAVVGNPIGHSRSPQIHQWFARQFDLELNYARIESEVGSFTQTVTDFFDSGGHGLNITTPFKQQAFELADIKQASARQAMSGNTLWMEKGQLQVASTDGDGWYEHIQHLGLALGGKKILLLGAGGAGRVILEYLRELDKAEEVVIANRSPEKLETLNLVGALQGVSLDVIPETTFDLIINALPTGWQNAFPDLSLTITDQTRAYDLNYADGANAFREWFSQAGGNEQSFYDGWGMLVCQAALSYEIWWGDKPEVEELINRPELIQED